MLHPGHSQLVGHFTLSRTKQSLIFLTKSSEYLSLIYSSSHSINCMPLRKQLKGFAERHPPTHLIGNLGATSWEYSDSHICFGVWEAQHCHVVLRWGLESFLDKGGWAFHMGKRSYQPWSICQQTLQANNVQFVVKAWNKRSCLPELCHAECTFPPLAFNVVSTNDLLR